jgi:hypothetical protein
MHKRSKTWDRPRQRREHQKSKHRQQWNHEAPRQVEQDLPTVLVLQRQVLSITLGAKVFSAMMINVCVVDERGHQERYAAEQIPNEPKEFQFARGALMHDFMNEHPCPVKQQTRRKEEERLVETALKPLVSLVDRSTINLRKANRTSCVGDKKVGPVDPHPWPKEITDVASASAERKLPLARRGA